MSTPIIGKRWKMIEMKGRTRMIIFTCNVREIVRFYERGTQNPEVWRRFCMFLFLSYTFNSCLPCPALTRWVTSTHPRRKPSVKASCMFLFFTSPLVKSIPRRAVPLVPLVLIEYRDMGQHNRLKHAQSSCLGKMEGGREAIAFRLSKLSRSLASACQWWEKAIVCCTVEFIWLELGGRIKGIILAYCF